MKKVFTLFLIASGLTVFAQQKTTKQEPVKNSKPASGATTTTSGSNTIQLQKPSTPPSTETQAFPDPRNAGTSAQSRTTAASALPYDVNDVYMGRKAEFLNDITLPELPADFPKYEKQWGVKEYNQVVDAYFINHKDILKDNVRAKVESFQQH